MVKLDLFDVENHPSSTFEVIHHKAGSRSFLMRLYRDDVDTGIIIQATPYSAHIPPFEYISIHERDAAICLAGSLCKAS